MVYCSACMKTWCGTGVSRKLCASGITRRPTCGTTMPVCLFLEMRAGGGQVPIPCTASDVCVGESFHPIPWPSPQRDEDFSFKFFSSHTEMGSDTARGTGGKWFILPFASDLSASSYEKKRVAFRKSPISFRGMSTQFHHIWIGPIAWHIITLSFHGEGMAAQTVPSQQWTTSIWIIIVTSYFAL